MASESRSRHGRQGAPRVKKGRKRGGGRASPQRAHSGWKTGKRKRRKRESSVGTGKVEVVSKGKATIA